MSAQELTAVHVIGGGRAGSEAGWQIARARVPVVLREEMRRLGHITGGHIAGGAKSFQPMNVNFGLFPPIAAPEGRRITRKERKPALAARALADLDAWSNAAAMAAE